MSVQGFHRGLRVNTADAKDVHATVGSAPNIEDIIVPAQFRYNSWRNRMELVQVDENGPTRLLDYRPLTAKERARYRAEQAILAGMYQS